MILSDLMDLIHRASLKAAGGAMDTLLNPRWRPSRHCPGLASRVLQGLADAAEGSRRNLQRAAVARGRRNAGHSACPSCRHADAGRHRQAACQRRGGRRLARGHTAQWRPVAALAARRNSTAHGPGGGRPGAAGRRTNAAWPRRPKPVPRCRRNRPRFWKYRTLPKKMVIRCWRHMSATMSALSAHADGPS